MSSISGGAHDYERTHPSRSRPTAISTGAQAHVINQSGAVVDLTPQEYNLLAALVERPRRVHGREAIAGLMHRGDGSIDDRNIDALVSRLRRKLNGHVDAAALIQTVRGEGYVLASEVNWTGKDEV